jgi:hypothetical protein
VIWNLYSENPPRPLQTEPGSSSVPHCFVQGRRSNASVNDIPLQGKKVYAVRKGFVCGLFYTWEACEKAVKGYSGAKFKSFKTKEDALHYLGSEY